MRALRLLLLTGLLLAGASGLARTARADDFSAVEITLAGGEVVGKTAGLGTASVAAKVRNASGRTLEGIRVAVYYSQLDAAPPAQGADWRVHEFVFEPPLKPGGSSTLHFKDEGAAEYVLIQPRRIKFAAAVSFGGKLAATQWPLLEQEGATYIAVRDLMDLAGGSISSAAGSSIQLTRKGRVVELKPASAEATLDGKPQALGRPLLQVNGRAYIAIDDAARLLGLTVTRDGNTDLTDLADVP